MAPMIDKAPNWGSENKFERFQMVLRWMDALQVVLVRLSNWFQIKVLGFPIKNFRLQRDYPTKTSI